VLTRTSAGLVPVVVFIQKVLGNRKDRHSKEVTVLPRSVTAILSLFFCNFVTK
jgi:hypothetical protein